MHFNSKVLHGQKREQRSARETDGKSPTKYGAVPALFHEPLSLQMIIAVYLRSLALQLAVATAEHRAGVTGVGCLRGSLGALGDLASAVKNQTCRVSDF